MTTTDQYHENPARHDDITAPLEHAFAITPDDDAELSKFTRAIFVGVSGDLVVQFVGDDDTVTVKNVAAGVWHPMRVRLVHTDSTATDILGAY